MLLKKIFAPQSIESYEIVYVVTTHNLANLNLDIKIEPNGINDNFCFYS